MQDIVRTILMQRGVRDEDMHAFLNPDYSEHTHDTMLMPDMDRAVERILEAIRARERIAIYADFDCDGIPGAALLSDLFQKIGYDAVEVYIPHRDREGYGFHIPAIDTLISHGVKLIITVDVGTVAVEGCAHAQSRGVDVIVTDHHEIIGNLPPAYAVVNPKRNPYPYPHLCGTGVAFKLACAILAQLRGSVVEGWEKWLLDLVAIATVADMVPMTGENRVLAYWGLRVLRKTPRPGIVSLCKQIRLLQSELTEDDIGFSLAPRINAASRMDDPELAFRLLTTRDVEEAGKLASKLESLNASRKGIVSSIVKQARARVAQRYDDSDQITVIGDTAWKPSLLGLVANSLVQDRGGVVCVWGRDANGNLKGSCRSDGSLSIVDLFAAARDTFIECGGHAGSGGFSVSHEQVHTLQEALSAKAVSLNGLNLANTHKSVAPDIQLPLSAARWPVFAELSRMAPFGIEHKKPIVHIRGVRVDSVKVFGKERNHVELALSCAETGAKARAFEFFKTATDFSRQVSPGMVADIHATIERDPYRGATAVALRIRDVL